MHARRIDHDDGSHTIKFCWNYCELLVLTTRQHRIFAGLVRLQSTEAGRDSLLQPGLLDALFALAARPWWDARLLPLAQEAESEMEPDPESGPVV